jgi:TetR/AcrR family fatty acid metabolism transcriptional regulator
MNEHSFISNIQLPGGDFIGPKSKPNSDKYHRILEAAVRVFARQSYFQSTVAQIAREAEVADGTIYLYFKNKEDILVQFFSYKTKQVFDGFREAVDQGDRAADRLRNLIQRHLTEFQNDPDMAHLYQSEMRRRNRVADREIRAMSKDYQDLVAEIIGQGQAEGSFRQDLNSILVRQMIIGTVDEIISTWLHSGLSYDLLDMTDPLVDLFLKGMSTHS